MQTNFLTKSSKCISKHSYSLYKLFKALQHRVEALNWQINRTFQGQAIAKVELFWCEIGKHEDNDRIMKSFVNRAN